MLQALSVALKVLLLTVVLVLCYMIGAFVCGLNKPLPAAPGQQTIAHQTVAQEAPAAQTAPDPQQLLKAMLIFCFAVAVAVSWIILRSRTSGWKLVAALFIGMYGVSTVLSQIESLIYLRNRMPPGLLPKLFVLGAVVALLFSPVAVFVLGKLRRWEEAPALSTRVPVRQWILPLLAVGVVYLALYMLFGYFCAWKNAAVRAYYGGTDPGSFPAQMKVIWDTRPWMFPFQIGRGIAWALFILPMIRLQRRSRWETGLAMALFCGVWSLVLLLPNALMPPEVARTHLFETLYSDLLFGAVAGAWLAHIATGRPGPLSIAREAGA